MADRDVLINENTMIAIANAIRNKSNSQTAYTPAQMPAAINQISGGSGGGSAITVTDTVDSHGGIIKTINAIDISDTTATAEDVASGKYFYTASGVKTAGTNAGYGGGGGSGEEYAQFKATPSETALSFQYDAGSFTLGTYYALYVYSTHSGNDPSHETIVLGGRYHLPYNEMAATAKDYGRVTTRKVNSGSDYWNSAMISVSQSGTTLTFTGDSTHAWWMGGVEYSFYIQNINEWASR